MKVSVTVTVDLEDPEQWTTAFGVEGRQRIREDVKTYVGGLVRDSGVFANGEVQAEVSWR